MKDISKNIVAKIKEGHIVPESRFKLQWKSYLFWLLMLLMILFGALSLSLAIFNVVDLDPRFLRHIGIGKFIFIFIRTAPYLWIALAFVALFFGIAAFRNTAKGYRSSTIFITSLIVLIISILGFFGHALKIDNRMHRVISDNAPGFKGMMAPRENRWLRPGDGLIGGEIISLESSSFILKSFNDSEWKISFDEKTEKKGIEELKIGDKVGVIGEKTDEFSMRAFSIKLFPPDWNGKPPRMQTPARDLQRDFPGSSPMGKMRQQEKMDF